jgi:hypothetical protein
MRGLKFKLDRRSLETIYMSFVRPCLEYGDVLWSGTYDTDLSRLDAMQVEAMRIVTGATARSNVDLLYEETGWPSFHERRLSHSLVQMYKVVNGLAPSHLSNILPNTVDQGNNYGLRSGNDIRVPYTRTESYRCSFFPHTIHEWNNLPAELKALPSVNEFKQAVKAQHQPTDLYYHGKRLLAVHHARTRLGCSNLNAHLCNNLHVIPSPRCQCGYELEDSMHFISIALGLMINATQCLLLLHQSLRSL